MRTAEGPPCQSASHTANFLTEITQTFCITPAIFQEKKIKRKRLRFGIMQRMFDNDHAELTPPLEDGKEGWYLPTFEGYRPQRPG